MQYAGGRDTAIAFFPCPLHPASSILLDIKIRLAGKRRFHFTPHFQPRFF
jgi:hypothetical protein